MYFGCNERKIILIKKYLSDNIKNNNSTDIGLFINT